MRRLIIGLLVAALAAVGLSFGPSASAAASGGVVVAFGSNLKGETVVPDGPGEALDGRTVTAVAAGGNHSLALTSDGTVVAWGDSSYGQTDVPDGPGEALDGETVTAIAAGGAHSLALTSDGSVVAWGLGDSGQTNVPDGPGEDGETVIAIAAGGTHSLALTSAGTVVAWGDDTRGQSSVPDRSGGALDGKTVTAIAAGAYHSLALTSDGTVVAWGDDGPGQSTVPDGPGGALEGKTVTAIAAGAFHSLALTSDGIVVAWGINGNGEINVPDGVGQPLEGRTVTAVAGGGSHSLALTSDGAVVAWGNNSSGQSAVPADLGQAAAISAGGAHSLVLVVPSPPVFDAPAATLSGTVGASFSYSPTVTGAAPITFSTGPTSEWPGPLPPGLSLDPATGEISGIPLESAVGTYKVQIGAQNSQGSAFQNLSISISKGTITGLDPTISGVAQQGQTLTADPGSVSPADSTFTYQWRRDGAPIPGATGSTYKVTKADVGKQLTVTVTATHLGYDDATKSSDPTAAVHAKYNRAEVQLSKTSAKRGQTVSVNGFGFHPGNTYTVRFNASIFGTGGTVVANVTADEYGELSVPLTIPNSSPSGPVTVTISGADPALVISTITITNG